MKKSSLTLLTSALCLLPIVFSVILFSDLPERIAVQWRVTGEVSNTMPRAAVAFGIPLFLAAANVYSKIRLFNDPKHENHSKALRALSIWSFPVVSIVMLPITLYVAMGANIPIITISILIAGLAFILIGNYLPKSRQNYVMGIKLPWTLDNADNWNKTNRLAGYVLVIGGVLIIINGFFLTTKTILGVSFTAIISMVTVAVPFLYSFLLYRKEQALLDK